MDDDSQAASRRGPELDSDGITGRDVRLQAQVERAAHLFVVYNRNRERVEGEWLFASEQLLAKVQYAVRF